MRVFVLVVLLILPVVSLAGPTVAILDLENHTPDASLDGAGAGIASILTSRFSKVAGIQLVERTKLTAVLAEIDLGKSGAVNKDSAAKAGLLLGADFLVMGDISSLKLPNLAVSLRVVRAETGEVVLAEDVVGNIGADGGEFFVLVDELAFQVIDGLQLRLSARERIALSQVEVQRLDTIRAYGGALQALDKGNSEDAERLLAEALSLEPGFTLAESALQQIAAEIKTERANYAHQDVTDAHAAWAQARTWVDAHASDAPTGAEVRRRALHARLLLVEGDIAGYFLAEQDRVAWTTEHVETLTAERGLGYSELRVGPLLEAAGVLEHRRTLGRELVFWPWQIRLQMARLRHRLGQRDAAIAEAIDIYQHPGPRSSHDTRLRNLDRTLEWMGASDVVVLLRRQQLQQAKLDGYGPDSRKALAALDKAERAASQYRENVSPWPQVTSGFERPATKASVTLEYGALRGASSREFRADYAQYRAFRRRVDDGYYDGIKASEERLWTSLAEAWYKIGELALSERWFADQRLEHLTALYEQVPLADEQEAESRQRDLESEIRRLYAQ